MVIQVVLGGPVPVFTWRKDLPVSQGRDMAGEILLALSLPGHKDLILKTYAHQSFVKRPVPKAAEGKAAS
jgi:hypothetical protein